LATLFNVRWAFSKSCTVAFPIIKVTLYSVGRLRILVAEVDHPENHFSYTHQPFGYSLDLLTLSTAEAWRFLHAVPSTL
jgi:hypothetical protein